ncbi:FAD-dependent oxidoreductase [Novisyntrophococcus fermenticellae]|uniref:FAD-dependent oxidoreductase n=1 Tax=Novisyntrophococcus fermenticellae TaxID=2068655 RepID=UPI001E4B5A61|nr:FAD-dependent oxidoreductase [Novisyntrophococcus fermenticellae]
MGEKIAIIGGGLTGCEIAYELVLQGKKPYIVEMLDDIVKVMGVSAANSNMLRELIRYHKIPVYLESSLVEIADKSIIIKTAEGTKTIEADSVITSIGYNPDVSLVSEDNEHIHIIEDAKRLEI